MSNNSSETYRNTAYYCDCISQIKVYKSKKQGGEALNQPILLLSIIDLIAQGAIEENRIAISDEAIDVFKKYWSLLARTPFKNSDFALPFFHLKNRKPKFWYLKFSDRYEGGRPQTINTLRNDVDYAYLDEEMFSILQDRYQRQELIDTLVTTWFSSKEGEIDDILRLNQGFQDIAEETEELEKDKNLDEKPKFYLRKSAIRNAFFRKTVVHLYEYRCAFCRLKVTQSLIQHIVDGAHIKPFAKFYDSKIDNGISLCKNHHWAFDRGLFCLDDDYKIIISDSLQEESPHATPMREFHGQMILLPNSSKYFPRLEAIRWHRDNLFTAE